MTNPSGLATDIDALESQGGGSSAGQAYRAELARAASGSAELEKSSSVGSDDLNSKPQDRPADARVADRKKVSGRARVNVAGGVTAAGKTIDISLTGVCILMDDMLPSKKLCSLEFDIFHVGTRYVFGVQAVSVYSVLVSGKGFKVGFQFGPRGPAAQTAIAALVA